MLSDVGGGFRGGPIGVLNQFGRHEDGKIDSRVLRRMIGFVFPYWHLLAGSGIFMLFSTAGSLIAPYLTKIIIDDHIVNGNLAGLAAVSLLLTATLFITHAASSGQQYTLSKTGQKVLRTMRGRMFEHLQKLSVSYHTRHIIGVTVSRIVNDVSVINNLLSEGLLSTLGDTLVLFGTVTIMLFMDLRLALLAFAVIPLMVLATYIFSRKAKRAYRETRKRIADLVGDLAENLAGMRVIQAFCQEKFSQGRFEKYNNLNRIINIRAMSLSFVFLPVVDILSVISTCVVLWAGGIMIARGRLTIGVVVAFMTYVNRFFMPIRDLSQLYTTLQSATAGGERVLELLDTLPDIKDCPRPVEIGTTAGRIEFDSVSFAYIPDRNVLHDVSFVIPEGHTVAFVGQTGAGKTTITNLVLRFYDVTSGRVLLDGHDIRTIRQNDLHGLMGYVPQDPFLFSGTIAENIAFGRPGADRGEIVEAAVRTEAHDFIMRYPGGYDTHVYEGGTNLSVGQRQLICIARALLISPRIIIFDEATSSVDTVTEAMIRKALDVLLAGRTSVLIAHRLSTITRADMIHVVHDGTIAESGRHAELLALDGLYRNLYEKQFTKRDDTT